MQGPEGIEAFRALAKTADVVIENWSVGVSERLGIGYADLKALNPRLVMAQMPGFAQDAPESERVGFGPRRAPRASKWPRRFP